jgi:hypothetical protein
MYPIKLSQLSAATSVATTDILEIVDRDDLVMGSDGTNKNVTAQLLANSLCKMVTTNSSIIATTSEPALKIKQEGTGHCLLIEDFPLTDTSPLVVTSDGKVGIGTASPVDKVHVAGTVHLDGGTAQFQLNSGSQGVDSDKLTNTYISFGTAGAGGDWAYLRQIGTFNQQIISLDLHDDRPSSGSGAGFMIRQVGSFYGPPDEIYPSFYVDPSNKIGIGTATPSVPLDIASAGIHINANRIISSNSNSDNIILAGGAGANGANIELYGASHATAASHAYIDAEEIHLRSQNGTTTRVTVTSTGVNIPTLTTTTAAAGTNNTSVATTAFTQSTLLGTVETISANTNATISATYYNRYTRFTNTTAITVTLPALTPPPIGTKIRIRRAGTGSITLATSGSVVINGNTANTMPQHGTFDLIYVSADVWDYIQY